MQLNKFQLDKLSDFLIDLAKILFASSVVGFFVPGSSGQVNVIVFIAGVISTFGCLTAGLKILKKINDNQ